MAVEETQNLALDVCVLIPCHNNQAGLLRSLGSICYPESKLYVVVVDDGSEVPVSLEGVRLALQNRVQVIRLAENRGITQALNAGLQWVLEQLQVKCIARLDCGDLCHEERFERQVAFLESNPQVGLLGSWCVFHQPGSSLSYTYTTPLRHEEIMAEMHRRNVFIHPSVMFRANLVREVGLYPTDYPLVEDYALFYQMLARMEGAVLDQFLVTCEINPSGISMANRKKQLQARAAVVSAFGNRLVLKWLGLLKLKLLMYLPYSVILHLKQKLS